MKRKLIFLTSLSVLSLIFITSFVLYHKQKTSIQTGRKIVEFEVLPEDSSFKIAEELEKENLIKSKWLALVYLMLQKKTVKAGIYELRTPSSFAEIMTVLTSGKTKELTVTFPEGFCVREIAERLEEKGVLDKNQFLVEVSLVSKYQRDFPFLANVNTQTLEGYLFPDTYRFSPKTEPEKVVRKMLNAFDKKVNKSLYQEIKKQSRTINDLLIIASIVEREAKTEEDREKIASVYLNRLEKGMKLEADPTIQYAKGNWEPVKKEEYYTIKSPYNTYLFPGLPPGPIANPGLASIKAVLNPAKTEYLYFFHTKDGNTVYSKDIKEHQEKIRLYLGL